jgi:hypothetical protein
MKGWLHRVLNIDPEDLGRGLLLSTGLFLVISCYVIGKVARDALFLARFQAVQLPYADIASGILVGFVVSGYLRLGRRTSLRTLLVGSQLFFAANCAKSFWSACPDPDVDTGELLADHAGSEASFRNGWWRCDSRVGFCRLCLKVGSTCVWHGESSTVDGSASGDFLRVDHAACKTGKFQPTESRELVAETSGIGEKDVQGSLRLVFSSKYLCALAGSP